MRYLALDWGRVRIGAAVSDESGKISFALDRYFDIKNAIEELIRFTSEKDVGKILVGNPISLAGEKGESSSPWINKAPCLYLPLELVGKSSKGVFASIIALAGGLPVVSARRFSIKALH